MNNKSRVASSVKNVTYSLGGQLLNMLFSFITRSVFIYFLNIEYLGLNGLFTNILSILSLAELGIGSAITFSLFKPLADNDQQFVKTIMDFYAKAYRIIGFTIALSGLALAPFLDFFIKNKPNIPNLTLIYLLYLTGSVISYFFTYKRTIIIASQNQYIDTVNVQFFNIIKNILQISILFFMHNFIFYLIIQIACTLASNITISIRADKMFPYLKSYGKMPLEANERKLIFKNIGALSMHKIAGVVVFGISNLLISKYLGLEWVGIYSNYTLIIVSLNSFLSQIFSSIIPSIGNLNASESKEKSFEAFKVIDLLNFWLYSSTSIVLFFIINPFITIWIGHKYLLDNLSVSFMILNYFITGRRFSVLTFKTASGLFWNDRFKPIAETAINIVLSVFLLKQLGLVGVFIATLFSTLLTGFWVEPFVTFKHAFNIPVKRYFLKYFYYFLIMVIIVLLSSGLLYCLRTYFQNDFLIRCFISILIPNVFFLILFYKTDEFIYLKKVLMNVIFGK